MKTVPGHMYAVRAAAAVLAMLGGLCRLAALDVAGIIADDRVWRMAAPDDTVRVRDDVYIRDGATVTVAPGTVLRGFNSSGSPWKYNIFVEGNGRIRAAGTADSLIVFRNVCVEFSGTGADAGTCLKYCSFYDGWGHAEVEFRNAATPAAPGDISEVLIENCRFTAGSYCLAYVTSGARPVFRGCTFTASEGCGILMHGGGDMIIDSCVFSRLSAAVCCAGMGDTARWWEPVAVAVNHCTFYGISRQGAAGFTTVPGANGYGITAVNYPGTLSVRNSVFSGLAESAVRDLNRETPGSPGDWTVATDYNLFYGLGGDPLRLMDAGLHSIEADPLFADTAAGDFSLRYGSPAAGSADDGGNRGAVQNIPSSVSRGVPEAPAGSIMHISTGGGSTEFRLARSMPGSLVIHDAAGGVAAVILLDGRTAVTWNGPAAPGIYCARPSAGPADAARMFIRF